MKVQVLFAGDSNLKFISKAFPVPRHDVEVLSVAGARVVNDGKCFQQTLQSRLQGMRTTPNVVFLHVGSNDVGKFVTLHRFVRDLGILVDSIHRVAPEALVKLCSILPREWNHYQVALWNRNTLPRLQEDVDYLNSLLRVFCADRKLELVRYTIPQYHFGRDGLHVTPHGAKCLLSAILGTVDSKYFAHVPTVHDEVPPCVSRTIPDVHVGCKTTTVETLKAAATCPAVRTPYAVADVGVTFGWSDEPEVCPQSSDTSVVKSTDGNKSVSEPNVPVVLDERDKTNISRLLSFILRHGGLSFTPDSEGFLYVTYILENVKRLKKYTTAHIQDIVATDSKQRYCLKMDVKGQLMIRANQGHSIEVPDLEVSPILTLDDTQDVIHGTYQALWDDSIKMQGLSRTKRKSIHFAVGEPGDDGVISGMRSDCDVMIYIDMRKALEDGLTFFRSSNNVILSPGDDEGMIHPRYFKCAVNRLSRNLLPYDCQTGRIADQKRERQTRYISDESYSAPIQPPSMEMTDNAWKEPMLYRKIGENSTGRCDNICETTYFNGSNTDSKWRRSKPKAPFTTRQV